MCSGKQFMCIAYLLYNISSMKCSLYRHRRFANFPLKVKWCNRSVNRRNFLPCFMFILCRLWVQASLAHFRETNTNARIRE
jgi:hypothetical protein